MNRKFYFIALLTVILFIPLIVIAQDDQAFNLRICEYDLKKHQWISLSEDLYYPGDQTIDVKYYKLDLEVTTSPEYISGKVTILARVDTTMINSLFLDFAENMIVDSIIIQEATPALYNQIEDKIIISLDRSYLLNEVVYLTIYYQGLPNSDLYGFGFNFGVHNGFPVIWSQSEPYFANYWWPCKDTPTDKADSVDIILTVDTSLIPVSNGSLQEVRENGNGTHTYFWQVRYPIAQYLISVAISNYQLYTNYFVYSAYDSMAVTNYLYPESYTQQNIDKLDLVLEMLAVYSSLFGEYPFLNEKYGHAECYTAMEHQTITSIVAFDEDLVSHETAHQWFGDKVTCKDWHHIWLNEGFATYGTLLWSESRYGKAAYNQNVSSRMNYVKTLTNSVWVEDVSDPANIFRGESYSRGCIVLHMLRGVMGDSLFFKTLYDYINDPELAYGVAITEDFQRVAEEVYGEDLDYFFSQWIYGIKYPKYKIYWGKEQVDTTWNIGIKIEQTVNCSPSFFTMPIEIKINYTAGDTIIKLFNDAQIQDYTLNLPLEPISINFDPNNWILKDVLSIVLDMDDEKLPEDFNLSQNYPNPFNPNTVINYQLPMSSDVTLKVYDIIGNEIATLVNEYKPAGTYEVEFNTSSINHIPSSGVYFYQLKAGDFIQTKKMILLK
ncbi:MAG: T9SS type A sorting domain-containing protein [Ignavibacterium sp.]|nr:T9SS type A sorting domain-containing protein [Ignavibacterium sp.]